MKRLTAVLVITSSMLASCGVHKAYENTEVGQLEGVLEVRWLEPDRFLFVPSKSNPLRFTTADGMRTIKPGPMYTDGGSIPRIFWSVPGYSPWGIAPAYIIHDWLFVAHHCDIPDYNSVTFTDSSRFMGESIKTLMETSKVPKDESLFFNIVAAVKTPIARKLWDKGVCDLPPDQLAYGTISDVRPLLARELEDVKLKIQKVESDMRVTPDTTLKKKYAAEVKNLRNELKRVDQLSIISNAKPMNAPATKLLYTIDMSSP